MVVSKPSTFLIAFGIFNLTYSTHCGIWIILLSILWKFQTILSMKWKVYILLSTLRKISQGAFHIVEAIIVSSTNYLNYLTVTLSIVDHLEHFFPHFLNCAYIFAEDFHKSFCNLSNFFREHARGTRAIFHLWGKSKGNLM